MSAVPESVVETVVQDISQRMTDPSYGQLAVGGFAQAHPEAGRFLTAHLKQLGGSEEVIHAVFHAHVLSECLERHRGRHLRPIGFRELDEVSSPDLRAKLSAEEPALAAYIGSNVEGEAAQSILARIGLALAEA